MYNEKEREMHIKLAELAKAAQVECAKIAAQAAVEVALINNGLLGIEILEQRKIK